MTQAQPILDIAGLRSGYGRADDIIRGIDIAHHAKQILTVIGPNGSGKSTFIKTIAGLVPTRGGSIRLLDKDVTSLSPARRTASGLAYVPQESNVFRSMTIRENLQLATEFLHSRKETEQRIEDEVMEMFPELGQRPSTLAGNLSGGQRQMLAFACALLANPDVLLLDEPSAGLSPKFVDEIMQAVLKVRESGVTIVLVEQNVTAGLEIADQVALIVDGRLIQHAPRSQINQADLEAMFLGQEVSA